MNLRIRIFATQRTQSVTIPDSNQILNRSIRITCLSTTRPFSTPRQRMTLIPLPVTNLWKVGSSSVPWIRDRIPENGHDQLCTLRHELIRIARTLRLRTNPLATTLGLYWKVLSRQPTSTSFSSVATGGGNPLPL